MKTAFMHITVPLHIPFHHTDGARSTTDPETTDNLLVMFGGF